MRRGQKKASRKGVIIGIIIGIPVLALGIFFLVVNTQAKSRFADGTQINGIDVSGMKLSDLDSKIGQYSLKIVGRDGQGESMEAVLGGQELGVYVGENDEAAKDILKKQGIWQYLAGKGSSYQVENWIACDETKLSEAVASLPFFDETSWIVPTDAYISDYMQGTGYAIVPEQEGNTLKKEKAKQVIEDAVYGMKSQINLEEEDCYRKAAVTSEDEKLNATLDTLNKYVGVTITYHFDEDEVVVDGGMISEWLKVGKKGNVTFRKEKVAEFVASIRRKYDTIFGTRKFKTSYGNTVNVVGGDYGWWMNYSEEERQLIKQIKKGKSGERTPVYHQTAKSYGKHDYGNTYVEINLTTQHIFLYVKGKKILESDCVTGNAARGFATPAGTYSITYTERDATLEGENYSTPVSYWMPFNKNIGLHDAGWRSSFGGTIYKYNGSHGCVNLPPDIAQKLFGYVEKGTPVICYESEETLGLKDEAGQEDGSGQKNNNEAQEEE